MESVNSENSTNRLTPSTMHLKKKKKRRGALFYSFEGSEWRILSIISQPTQYHTEIHIYCLQQLCYNENISLEDRGEEKLSVGALACLSNGHIIPTRLLKNMSHTSQPLENAL